MIDPFEESAAELAAMPPQPQSFTPGYVQCQDYVEYANMLNDAMVASLGIPKAILDGDTNYSGYARMTIAVVNPECTATALIEVAQK